MEIKITSLDNIHDAAKQFIAAMGDNTVFAFYGKMGAGSRMRRVGRDGRHQLPHICNHQ